MLRLSSGGQTPSSPVFQHPEKSSPTVRMEPPERIRKPFLSWAEASTALWCWRDEGPVQCPVPTTPTGPARPCFWLSRCPLASVSSGIYRLTRLSFWLAFGAWIPSPRPELGLGVPLGARGSLGRTHALLVLGAPSHDKSTGNRFAHNTFQSGNAFFI